MSSPQSLHRPLVYLVTTLLLTSGCASTQAAGLFPGGGNSWRRLQSEHFDLRTDLPQPEARKAILYLESTRAALLAAAWPGMRLPETNRLGVYVFANLNDFQELAGRRADGFFIRDAVQPFIVLHDAPDTWVKRDARHPTETYSVLNSELTHYLSARVLRRQPRWFAEGLAQFLETLQLSEDGTQATLGMVNFRAYRTFHKSRTVKVNDLLDWDATSAQQLNETEFFARYAMSWGLVYWIYNTHPKEFGELQKRFAKGQEPRKAFLEVFANLPPEQMNPILFDYMNFTEYRQSTLPIPPVTVAPKVFRLNEADVHALRALVGSYGASFTTEGNIAGRVESEINEALQRDPGNVTAVRLRLPKVHDQQALALARVAVERHPDDGEAWLLLADTLGATRGSLAEQEATLLEATKRSPESVPAASALAWLYVTHGRADEAQPFIQRAMSLEPGDSFILDTGAAVAAGLGNWGEAVELEQRALDVLPERTDPKSAHELRVRLARYSQRAHPAGEPPSNPPGP